MDSGIAAESVKIYLVISCHGDPVNQQMFRLGYEIHFYSNGHIVNHGISISLLTDNHFWLELLCDTDHMS